MKKLYQQPTIEQETLLVEAGIAQSGYWDEIDIDNSSSAGSLEENTWY